MIEVLKRGVQLNFQSMFFKVTLIDQPKMRRRSLVPIYPPPGMDLQIPEWTPEQFLLKIGNGSSDYADKFENINEVFTLNRHQLKGKGIPAKVRKYIFSMREELRRGVLTFDYLERRTSLVKPKVKK